MDFDPTPAAVDWLLGVRALGLVWANILEDRRLKLCDEENREVTFTEALAIELIEDCGLAGVTYYHGETFYLTPTYWPEWDAESVEASA
jgi:hypothetical protein